MRYAWDPAEGRVPACCTVPRNGPPGGQVGPLILARSLLDAPAVWPVVPAGKPATDARRSGRVGTRGRAAVRLRRVAGYPSRDGAARLGVQGARRDDHHRRGDARHASGSWRFRRRGPTSGSAPRRRATCRPPAATRKGRKQYRYHARWREVRDETKYDRMIAFGEALPKIRARNRARPRAARAAAREGARHGRPAAREDADSRRQRRVREAEQVVRPDHHARPPRRGERLHRPLRVPRQERQGACDRPAQPQARRHRQALPRSPRLRAVPVRRRERRRGR